MPIVKHLILLITTTQGLTYCCAKDKAVDCVTHLHVEFVVLDYFFYLSLLFSVSLSFLFYLTTILQLRSLYSVQY